MCLIGAMVCLLAAPLVQLSVSTSNGWPHNALRHHWFMPIRCHFRDCKALLVTSLTHVSGAITSVHTPKSPGPVCGWVGRILRSGSCISGSSWPKVLLLFVDVPLYQPLLPCSSQCYTAVPLIISPVSVWCL